MSHSSPSRIMSQLPHDKPYDPVNNYACVQSSAAAVYPSTMRWSEGEQYQLRKPQQPYPAVWSRYEQYQLRKPPGIGIAAPPGQFAAAYFHTTPYSNQQPAPNNHVMQHSTASEAAPPLNAAFEPANVHPSHTGYVSYGAYPSNAPHCSGALYLPTLEQPNHALAPVVSNDPQQPNRDAESNVVHVGSNHAVGWQGNPCDYQQVLAEKANANSSNHAPRFSRMRNKGNSPTRKALSINDLVHDDARATLPPAPSLQRGSNESTHLQVSADIPRSPHTVQNKKAALNVPVRSVFRSERVVATPGRGNDRPVHAETVVDMKHEAVAVQAEKPACPVASQQRNNISKPNIVRTNDVKVEKTGRPVPKQDDKEDVPLGALTRKRPLKVEPSLRRRGTPVATEDIFSTVPLKTSKFAAQNEEKKRKEKAALAKGRRVKGSRVTKSTKPKKKLQGKRGIHSYSLFEHSGDESDESSEGRKDHGRDERRARKKPSTFSNSDDEDFDDITSRSKQKSSKRRKDEEEANLNRVNRSNTSQKKGKDVRDGTRKSSRLSKRKMKTELELEGKSVKRRKEVHKNPRRVEKSKSLDELSDEGGAQTESSDDSGDFVPTSARGKRFEVMKAKWQANQRKAAEQSSTPKKGAKRTPKKQKKRKRTPAKGNASDGDNTRVDDQESDSYSPNASQRGSQPLNVKITSLATGRRKRKVDYEDERKRLTEKEFTMIRIAFTAHYPPPPSNSQAQGRFEMKYGREMSQAMIQGLWEKELKHWSERWWSLYMGFNDIVRGKKLAKPVDKNPSLNEKEVERWAKSFYEEHGDARVSPKGLKPDGNKSDNSKGSKNGNDSQPSDKGSNTEKDESDKCLPKTEVDRGHPSGDQTAIEKRADPTSKEAQYCRDEA